MKYHLVRWGAYGDAVFIQPVIRYLKNRGHSVTLSASSRIADVLRHDPSIDRLIEVDTDKISDTPTYWKHEREEVKADKYINFSESIEVSLLKHPEDPDYNLPKDERVKVGNVNAFDQSFMWAGIDPKTVDSEEKRPVLYFTDEEEEKIEKFFDAYDGMGFNLEPRKKFIIMWVLSGSGFQKAYPYGMEVMKHFLEKYDNVYFLTVGDEVSRLLEMDIGTHKESARVIAKAGKWTMRETMLATKCAQIVVGPETGVLVASGAYDTPKIGMFSSITANHATTYFKNDHSIEAKGVSCAPCFRMIYRRFQCPDHPSGATLCMGSGFDVARVTGHIESVIDKHYQLEKRSPDRELSCVR